MIVGFRHKGLQRFFSSGSTRGIQPAHARKLEMILAMLNAAQQPGDLNLPALRLHHLKGDLAGHWSVWVNGNWRVTFRFVGSDVELVDYQELPLNERMTMQQQQFSMRVNRSCIFGEAG